MGSFTVSIIHEYIHVYQQNILKMDNTMEREFLANAFSVFPNTSYMRSLIPDWTVELPEATEGQKWLCAKGVVTKYYPNLSVADQNKYKAEYDKVKAVYESLKSKYGKKENKDNDSNSGSKGDSKNNSKAASKSKSKGGAGSGGHRSNQPWNGQL